MPAPGPSELAPDELVEVLGEGLCALDADGRVTFLNRAAADMLNVIPDEVYGLRLHDLTHRDSRDVGPAWETECPVCTNVRSGEARHVDHDVFWRPDGTSFPVEYSVWPVTRNGAAEQPGAVLRFTDITGRGLRAHEVLSVMASAQCLLWYADIQYVTQKDRLRWFLWPADLDAARRFLPFPIQPGQPFSDAFYACRLDEDKARTDGYGKEHVLAGQSYQQQYRCRREDGQVRWINEEVRVERLAEHRWRAVGVCTDITALKEREHQIEVLNARLQRAMAETHHRVKNNLQVIAALIEILSTSDGQPVPAVEMARLRRHVCALAAIHDLLTEAAKSEGCVEEVSVRTTMQSLMPLLQEAVHPRTLRFELDDADLPVRKATSLAILANELVANAVKHGRQDVQVRFVVEPRQGRLEVLDDGSGFAPGFSPADCSGTGLQLIDSLSKWDLQGTVSYANRPEGGGHVTVRFPLGHL